MAEHDFTPSKDAKQYPSDRRAYRAWYDMRRRCENPNHAYYHNYGGRGIRVCERWQSFENFHADMGDPPKGRSLDRRDNDGLYEPANCRWATRSAQMRNTRRQIEPGKLNNITLRNCRSLDDYVELIKRHGRPGEPRKKAKRKLRVVCRTEPYICPPDIGYPMIRSKNDWRERWEQGPYGKPEYTDPVKL